MRKTTLTQVAMAGAVAGLLGIGASTASAITFTANSSQISFDPATLTFTGWNMGGVSQLGASGMGLSLSTMPSLTLNNSSATSAKYVFGSAGELDITFTATPDSQTSALTVSVLGGPTDRLGVVTSTNDIELGGSASGQTFSYTTDPNQAVTEDGSNGTWSVIQTASAGDVFGSPAALSVNPVSTPSSSAYGYSADLSNAFIPTFTLSTQIQPAAPTGAVPEPMSAVLGLTGLAVLGLGATRRRATEE